MVLPSNHLTCFRSGRSSLALAKDRNCCADRRHVKELSIQSGTRVEIVDLGRRDWDES